VKSLTYTQKNVQGRSQDIFPVGGGFRPPAGSVNGAPMTVWIVLD